MDDIKQILIDIKDALLDIKEELSRSNSLKEVELGITSETIYKADEYCKKLRKKKDNE